MSTVSADPIIVTRDGKLWCKEEGPDSAVRLVRWATKDDVSYIEDLCEMPQSRYDYEVKKGWIKVN